jgi:hypothetical protein
MKSKLARLFALILILSSQTAVPVAQAQNNLPANVPALPSNNPLIVNGAAEVPAQRREKAPDKTPAAAPSVFEPLIALHATSTLNLTSEISGAFMPPVKCDADGNLYIRKFAPNRPRGPVVKIGPDGKPNGLFDPAMFAGLALDRVDAFSPAPDGGIFQIAQKGIIKPLIYVLHYSSDGSASSPSRLEADFEVYTFAAFPDGSFLVSGSQRDPMDKNDHGRGVTKVFSSDGRELATVTFQETSRKHTQPAAANAGAPPMQKDAPSEAAKPAEKPAGALDLKDAEVSRDGNLYVMRASSQALIDVVSPGGKIVKTLRIAVPMPGAVPNSFHVSENRLAVLFMNGSDGNAVEKLSDAIAVVDGQTGHKIAAYSATNDLGVFACYSANDGVFTFLKHADGNVLQVIRAEAQ